MGSMDNSTSAAPAGGSHIRNVFSDRRLALLNKNKTLTDVTLLAGPPTERVSIRAHRVVLALASQYFWDQFVDRTERDLQCKVFGIDPSTLEVLVKFIYTGEVELTEDNVEQLCASATLLEIDAFKDKCLEFMTLNVDEKTWPRRLKFAREQACPDLQDLTIAYINGDYLTFLGKEEFLNLSLEDVLTVLNAPARLDQPDETIFSHVIKWLKHKPDERTQHGKSLMEEIDLGSLPEDFLQFHFDKEQVLHSLECLEMYNKVCKQGEKVVLKAREVDEEIFIFPEPPEASSSKKGQERRSTRHKRALNNSDTIAKEVVDVEKPPEKRSKDEQVPVQVPVSLPPGRFVARKKTGGTRQNYDAIKRQELLAKEAADLREKVAEKEKAADAGELPGKSKDDVNKGKDGEMADAEILSRTSSDLSTVKNTLSDSTTKTDSEIRTIAETDIIWKIVYLREIPNAHVRVAMSDLCSKHPQILRSFIKCNRSTSLLWDSKYRRLFALGGVTTVHSENGSSNQCWFSSEKNLYITKDIQWRKLPNMTQARTNFTPVIVDDYIYAFGGAEGICGNEAVNVAEKYALTGKKNRWENTDFLNRARQGFGAGVIEGKIYVCGGYGAEDSKPDSKMGILKTVECYDPKEDTWTLVSEMMVERHDLSVAVLDNKLYAIGGGGINTHTDFNKDFDTMMSVEMYDPKENCWNKVASMNRPRKNGSAIVISGKIYAVGGDVSLGEGQYKSSVEIYSPSLDKWQLVTEELDKEGNFLSVAVVDAKRTEKEQ